VIDGLTGTGNAYRGCEIPPDLLYDVERDVWVRPFPTPVAGTVVEINDAGYRADILIANRDPYGAGWLVRLDPDDWPVGTSGLVTGPEAVARYRARIDLLAVNCFRCAD